jgi:RHS repeat-associated protein
MRTNYAGSVGSSYVSLPWGDGYTATVNSSGADQENAHFADLERDAESGTEHAQFRNYTPTQGRWLSPDQYAGSYDATNPQSMNRYAYVLNNPMSMLDPSGLDTTCTEIDGVRYCVDDGGNGNTDCNSNYTACATSTDCVASGTEGCITASNPGTATSLQPTPSAPSSGSSGVPNRGIFTCAANTASKYSIAGGLHALGIGNNGGIGGFFTNTFGGNTYSGISNLISTLGSSSSTDQQVLTQMGKAYLRGPLQGIPASLVGASGTPFAASPTGLVRGAAVGAAFNAVTGANESLVTLSGEVGLSAVGTTAAEFATGVGEAKFALDTVSYLGSLAACAAGVAD